MGLNSFLPPFNLQNGLLAVALSTILWGLIYSIEYTVICFLMKTLKNIFPSTKYFVQMDLKEKKFYVSYFHGIFHALVSGLGAIYCFIYADGLPNTTWFHDHFYKMTMFDIQKYFSCLTAGYLVQDAIFCTINAKMDALMIQTYLHHSLGIIGCAFACSTGGFLGSMSQLTCITELSTPFCNLRWILA